jgi:AbrB family looped-hinge helix DNA binding protein
MVTHTEVTMRTEYVKIGEDGRVVIPSSLRKELGIKPGDTLVLESDGNSLLVRGYEQVLQEVQDAFAGTAPPGLLLSEELLGDRRDEADRESSD